jgi:hypothetical protein
MIVVPSAIVRLLFWSWQLSFPAAPTLALYSWSWWTGLWAVCARCRQTVSSVCSTMCLLCMANWSNLSWASWVRWFTQLWFVSWSWPWPPVLWRSIPADAVHTTCAFTIPGEGNSLNWADRHKWNIWDQFLAPFIYFICKYRLMVLFCVYVCLCACTYVHTCMHTPVLVITSS